MDETQTLTPEASETPPEADYGQSPVAVDLYVCPECGSWYGSTHTPDLAEVPNLRSSMRNLADEDPANWGSSSGTRIECQICRAAGKQTKRLRARYIRADHIQQLLDDAVEAAFLEEEKKGGLKLPRSTRQ